MSYRLVKSTVAGGLLNYRSRTHLTCLCSRLFSLSSSKQIKDGRGSERIHFATSPIFYVNASPHIGHLYTALIADALTRWQHLKQVPVINSIGTDEHGLKIQKAAASASKEPKLFCDEVSNKFMELFDVAGIKYSHFIRTTDERHQQVVQDFWMKLWEAGHIYKGNYEGWYSTSDEAFLTDEQTKDIVKDDGTKQKVSIESGHVVDWVKEENYMFRLSNFQDELLKWVNSDVIKPKIFENSVRSWIEQGLPDLSISRQRDRLQWGIAVPNDDSQTIYVWLDALLNYLTVSGYPEAQNTWPPDCQVIGKDILKFHAIYWPAFLMAVGLEPPKHIHCHSHWLYDNAKMSKSLGNVVDPKDIINRYGVDLLRYFLLRIGVPHSDGNFDSQAFVNTSNAELLNTLGNLLARVTSEKCNVMQFIPLKGKRCLRRLKERYQHDQERINAILNLPGIVDQHFSNLDFYKGIDAIMAQLRVANSICEMSKIWMWRMNPNPDGILEHCSAYIFEVLRISAILLQPIIPQSCDKILTQLNVSESERTFQHAKEMFVEELAGTYRNLGVIDGKVFNQLSLISNVEKKAIDTKKPKSNKRKRDKKQNLNISQETIR